MKPTNELDHLAIKYGTDKFGKHNYTMYYYEMFKDRRNEINSVLEIGVANGAGLRMFRDFFPNATIYGAEIDENRIFKENRIKVLKFDQSSASDVSDLFRLMSDVDIVIDDGSHDPMDQMFTCYGAMSILNEDVVYIIEDVADVRIIKYLNKYDCRVIECGKRYDDRLVIVRHKHEMSDQ